MSWREWVEQPKKVVDKVTDKVNEKRTHITVAVAMVLSFLEAFDIWTPPVWVWTLLGFAGLSFLRMGVKNTKTVIQQMIKELNNMKKVIPIIAVALVLCVSGTAKANGVTLWGLTEQDLDSTQNALTARVGYQYDFVEGFLGSTWRPNYDVETGEIEPPQVLSLGAICHMRDLLDPNNPLPWVPDLLLSFIPEEWVAQPYLGGQGTFNFFDKDAGFYGAIVGLQCKLEEDKKGAFIVEANWNDNFGKLAAVPNKFQLNLGFRFLF